MKMTITDITEGMNSSHEGYAGLVADSVSFSLGRSLTDEELIQIYGITGLAIDDAIKNLTVIETEED